MIGNLCLPSGLEAQLYPDRIEFYSHGQHRLTMTPQEYGEIMRWIESHLHELAQPPWSRG